jgi:hypothetical protein
MSAEILSHINTWSKEAKCGDNIDDDKFFGPTRTHNANGKKFCTGLIDGKQCPVISQCRTYAIVHELEGIWGGTTFQERKDLGPLIKDFLAQVYLEFHLYDHFLAVTVLSSEEEPPQRQQSEQSSPIGDLVPAWDSSLDLSA